LGSASTAARNAFSACAGSFFPRYTAPKRL
jgi:hypothetical protein